MKQREKRLIALKYKRKPSIIQMQVTGYIFGVKKQVFIINIPRDYRMAMKLIKSVPQKPKQKRGKKRDIRKLFQKIDHFIRK
ncbi:MAG: hypothetical protein ACTSYF_08150 [Promethearchaeota archaeon]